MEKNVKFTLVGISVALVIITAVYTTGITKRRAQTLLGRGYEVFDATYSFRTYRDIYTGMLIRRVSWISFQSALLEHSSRVAIVNINWYQMWFMTFETSYEPYGWYNEGGFYKNEFIVYYTDLGFLPLPHPMDLSVDPVS